VLLTFTYCMAILSNVTSVKTKVHLQNALYIATFLSLCLSTAYLWKRYRLRQPGYVLCANRYLLLYLLLLLAIQAIFHDLGAGLYIQLAGYIATAILAYVILPALMLPNRNLLIAWTRIVAAASAMLSLFGVISQFGLETIAGIPFATKTVRSYTILGIHATGGILDHPIRLGTQSVLGLAASLYLLRRRGSALNFALLTLNAVGIFISVSRAAWLAAMVGLLYAFFARTRNKGRISAYLLAPLAVGLLLLFAYGLASRWPFLGNALRLEYGLSNRELTWPFAASMIRLRPLVGYGFLSSEAVKKAYGGGVLPKTALDASFENNFIDTAVQSGVIVSVLYALAFLVPIHRAFHSRLEPNLRRLLVHASIAVMISALFTNYNIGGLRSTSLAAAVFLGLSNLSRSRVINAYDKESPSYRIHNHA